MSTYCEFVSRPKGDNSCKTTKDPNKDSQNCELNQKTRRCRIKPSLKKTLVNQGYLLLVLFLVPLIKNKQYL